MWIILVINLVLEHILVHDSVTVPMVVAVVVIVIVVMLQCLIREERKYGENRIDTSRVSNGDNLNLIGNHGGRPVSRAQRASREEFARCMKNKLCLRCKKPGHFARNCGKQQQPPKGRAQ